MPQLESNQENCGLYEVTKNDENYNQNSNMGNIFGVIFGTGKPEQMTEQKIITEINESMTNDQSKSTKNKGGRPANKNAKKMKALELANLKNRKHNC